MNENRLAGLKLFANRAGSFIGVGMEQCKSHPDPEEDQGQDCGPRGDPTATFHHDAFNVAGHAAVAKFMRASTHLPGTNGGRCSTRDRA
jgi:hypothetical protein